MDQSQAPATPVEGHMIVLGPTHAIAIYERNHRHYVAEFRDGRGSLEHAVAWFRVNARMLRSREGRNALELSRSLDTDIRVQIERLHAESEARQERLLALPRRIAAAARDSLVGMMVRLRGRAPGASGRPAG